MGEMRNLNACKVLQILLEVEKNYEFCSIMHDFIRRIQASFLTGPTVIASAAKQSRPN